MLNISYGLFGVLIYLLVYNANGIQSDDEGTFGNKS